MAWYKTVMCYSANGTKNKDVRYLGILSSFQILENLPSELIGHLAKTKTNTQNQKLK